MSRPGLVSRPSSVAAQAKTIVLVSGGNAGIGYEIVKQLSKIPNFQILLGCRDTRKGETAVASMGAPINVNPMQLDITDDTSIEHAYLTIAQMFGKLDILINNAGTSGRELGDVSARERADHIYSVNVTSTALLTDRMIPLLEKSKLPQLIFISSTLGSIQKMLDRSGPPHPAMSYSSSKAALNYLSAAYSKKYPEWKINAVDPGYRATKLNGAELNDETNPELGAVRVVELVQEGPNGATGTYTSKEGPLPW